MRAPVALAAIAALIFSMTLFAADVQNTKQLLREADDLYDTGDFAAAMDRYELAEKSDPAAADLDRLTRYASFRPELVPADKVKEDSTVALRIGRAAARIAVATPSNIDAIRLAARTLSDNGGAPEAISFLDGLLSKDAKNHAAAVERALLAARHEKTTDALSRAFERAAAAATTTEQNHFNGVVAYDAARHLSPDLAPTLIRVGKSELDRVLRANPDHFEALVYKSLLLKEEAKLAAPDAKESLIAEADKLRAHAMEVRKKAMNP